MLNETKHNNKHIKKIASRLYGATSADQCVKHRAVPVHRQAPVHLKIQNTTNEDVGYHECMVTYDDRSQTNKHTNMTIIADEQPTKTSMKTEKTTTTAAIRRNEKPSSSTQP